LPAAAQSSGDPDIAKLKRMLPKLEQLLQSRLPMLKQTLEGRMRGSSLNMRDLSPKLDRLEQRLRNIEQRLNRLEQKQLFRGTGGSYDSRTFR
jgi:chromosome segregation ATPase